MCKIKKITTFSSVTYLILSKKKKKIHIRAYTHLTENKKKVQTGFYQIPIHTFTGIQNITIGNN